MLVQGLNTCSRVRPSAGRLASVTCMRPRSTRYPRVIQSRASRTASSAVFGMTGWTLTPLTWSASGLPPDSTRITASIVAGATFGAHCAASSVHIEGLHQRLPSKAQAIAVIVGAVHFLLHAAELRPFLGRHARQ